jgi:hypothetical protein
VAVFSSGSNGKLTNINLSNTIEIENQLRISNRFSYRTLQSASSIFSLDYFTDASRTITKSDVKQSEINFKLNTHPIENNRLWSREKYC